MSIRSVTETMLGNAALRLGVARFYRDDKGATAIEFGLVALPFFALLFAILETALVFFAGQTLETAVSRSARLIRTGEAKSTGITATQFKQDICNQVIAVFDCPSKLYVDVRTYKTFGDVDLSKPLDSDGNLETNKFTYSLGDAGDIVVVRAFYEWPINVSMLGLNLGNTASGAYLLAATAAFKNEPFPW